MEARILGKTGYSVGIIAFGGIVVDGMAPKEAADIVSEAFERGVNYYDVAPSYGNAQYVLGPALEPYRKKTYLACKTMERTAHNARMELLESLKALKTDYFDNYQLHALNEPEEIETVFAPGGAMETLIWAKKQGVARNIGFTCHNDEAALSIMNRGEFSTMLFPVNFAYREQKSGSVSAVQKAKERNMGVIAIKSLALRKWRGGEEQTYPKCWYRPIFDDPALATNALNYTLSQDVDTAVPPGDPRMLRLALDIIEAQGGGAAKLSDEESRALRKAAAEISDIIF